jgi:hypothetical protein
MVARVSPFGDSLQARMMGCKAGITTELRSECIPFALLVGKISF